MFWLVIPISLQAVAMFFDELYFHRKRGLKKWEQLGHPIDTFFVFLCYLYISLNLPTETNLKIYLGLCLFSCLLITKDEFVHTEECEASENWLHALLFILHPITFMCSGYIWVKNLNATFLIIQPIVLFIVMLYQLIYWRFYEKSKQRHL